MPTPSSTDPAMPCPPEPTEVQDELRPPEPCPICLNEPGDPCDCCQECERSEDNCTCCSNCGSSNRDDCTCRYCEGCGEDVSGDDWRSCCDHCSDCCDCRDCDDCEERLNGSNYVDNLSTVCNDCLSNLEEVRDEDDVPEVTDPEALVVCANCCGLVPPAEICQHHIRTHGGRKYCFTCCGCAKCGHTEEGKCSTCNVCAACCVCVRCTSCHSKRMDACPVCNVCTSCCSCLRCGRYGSTSSHPSHIAEVLCSGCSMCPEACNCPKCETCNVKGGDRCSLCSQCSTCCTARGCGAYLRGGKSIYKTARELRFYTPTSIAHRRRNPTVREVSVEIEANVTKYPKKGLKLHNALVKWNDPVVKDSSIGESGSEINTNPSGGDYFFDHMRELCDGFEELGLTANSECGMHVHVNAKDVTHTDLRKIVMIYEKIERSIFDICHPRRLNGSYSLKCGDFFAANVVGADPRGFKQEIYAQLYNDGRKLGVVPKVRRSYFEVSYIHKMCKGKGCKRTDPGETNENFLCRDCWANPGRMKHTSLKDQASHLASGRAQKYYGLRYKALNLHSFFHRGTIEFRHHEGSTDYTTITQFGRICAEIINAGNRMSEAEIKALPKNSRRAFLEVVPEDLHPFIFAEWTKNDAVRKAQPAYINNYNDIWGL